jgi:hypothetical protein
MLGAFFYLAFGAEAIMFLFMLVDRRPLGSDKSSISSEPQPDVEEAQASHGSSLQIGE